MNKTLMHIFQRKYFKNGYDGYLVIKYAIILQRVCEF